MKSVFEIIMLVSFGFAWPFSIAKSFRSRSTKGKSVFFLFIVLAGYAAGILHKLINQFDFVITFYIVNFIMVSTDIAVFFRNQHLENKDPAGK